MSRRALTVLWFLGLASVLPASPLLRFTASLSGKLEGCACKAAPAAGLLKTAAWMRGEHDPRRDLLVDAGDFLDGEPDADLSTAILDTYRELAYTAIAVGDNDLRSGVSALFAARDRYPLLCNNLSIRDARGVWTAFSTEPVLVRRGTRSLGVMALLEPGLLALAGVRLADPVVRARALVAELTARGADAIVLLYHGTWESALRLVRLVPGITAAVVGHENRLEAGTVEAGTLLVSPGGAGSRVGALDLGSRDLAALASSVAYREFDARFGPDDPAVRLRVDAFNLKLRALLKSPAE